MSLKTIQMDPTHLKISKQKKTKKVIVPPSVMVHQPNLRQILLDKLLKHRKTQKRNDPMILNNSFDSQCSIVPVSTACLPETSVDKPYGESNKPYGVSDKPYGVSDKPYGVSDKPYGVLKNGIKPTYKQWNLTQKKINRNDASQTNPSQTMVNVIPVDIHLEEVNPENMNLVNPIQVDTIHKNQDTIHKNQDTIHKNQDTIQVDTIPLEKEYKKPVIIGKSKKNKTVHVLIPCHKTRKLRSEQSEIYKKTNLTTVKNYLKQHKLIRVGSTAPTNLIREIYENAKCYGDIVNQNKQNLLYNFEKEDKDNQEKEDKES